MCVGGNVIIYSQADSRFHRTTSSYQPKRKDDWHPNLRSGNIVYVDSTDGDSDVPGESTSSKARKSRPEDFRWLLDDSSQSRPSSPSVQH